MMGEYGLDSFGLRQKPGAGCFEQDNETFGSLE
jgi:hypothetical protein